MNNLAEITNIEKNILGTISIFLKVKGMRKVQDFIVYPISKNTDKIKIQSDTRIATVDLKGNGLMSKSHSNGAYFAHLQIDTLTPFTFSNSDWQQIKDYIGITEGFDVADKTTPLIIDNSKAKEIFKNA